MRVSVELGMMLVLTGFSAGAFSYVQSQPLPSVDHSQHAHHHHMAGVGSFKPIAVAEGSPRLHRAALSSLDETRAQIHRLKAQQVGEKTCLEEGGSRTTNQAGPNPSR